MAEIFRFEKLKADVGNMGGTRKGKEKKRERSEDREDIGRRSIVNKPRDEVVGVESASGERARVWRRMSEGPRPAPPPSDLNDHRY